MYSRYALFSLIYGFKMNIRKSVFNAGVLQQKEPKNPATPTVPG